MTLPYLGDAGNINNYKLMSKCTSNAYQFFYIQNVIQESLFVSSLDN